MDPRYEKAFWFHVPGSKTSKYKEKSYFYPSNMDPRDEKTI